MKAKIKSITIELKDYEPINFTMDEAKELYEQLDSLFGKEIEHVHHYDYWYRRPYYWIGGASTIGNQLTWTNAVSNTTFSADDLAGAEVTSSNTDMTVLYNAA